MTASQSRSQGPDPRDPYLLLVAYALRMLDAGIPIVSNQVQYSVLDRRPENGMSQLCSRHGVKLLCYGALAGGFLSPRWLGGAEPREPLDNRSLVKYRLIIEEFGGWALFQELLGELAAIAHGHGTTLSAIAARWVLDRPAVGGVIAGARNADHLEENAALLRLRLLEDDFARLDAALAKSVGPQGDTFGLERVLDGPHAAIMWKNLNRAE